jgi:hypothetical protein
MSGAIPPLTQYAFMAWCLVRAPKIRMHGAILPLPQNVFMLSSLIKQELRLREVVLS